MQHLLGAFRSLIDDLFHRDPVPLLYSKSPLEQTHQVVVNPRTDLLLSHIELAQARGHAALSVFIAVGSG